MSHSILYDLKTQIEIAEDLQLRPFTSQDWWDFFEDMRNEALLFQNNNEWRRNGYKFGSFEEMFFSFADRFIKCKYAVSAEWILFWKDVLAINTGIQFDQTACDDVMSDPRVDIYATWLRELD